MTYDKVDLDALLREHPRLGAPMSVRGPSLSFRLADPLDAEFVLSLRLDAEESEHLSAGKPELEAQRQCIAHATADVGQLYFIIETEGRQIGTVRLYDQRGTSFSWGSWILVDDAPKSAAIESALMVYRVGIDLGFSASHFQVRKRDEAVWQLHERFGATRTGETDDCYLYQIHKGAIFEAFKRYENRGKISVDW